VYRGVSYGGHLKHFAGILSVGGIQYEGGDLGGLGICSLGPAVHEAAGLAGRPGIGKGTGAAGSAVADRDQGSAMADHRGRSPPWLLHPAWPANRDRKANQGRRPA
jgi:hypothetical protein